MNCEQIEVWISAAQDGELEPRRQRLVDDHLATCAGCRELAAEWSALERTLRAGLARFDAPETLHTRVMQQIPERAAAPVGRRGSWTPGGWFSFGLVPVGAAAAWMLLTGSPGPKPQPTPVPSPVPIAAGNVDSTPATATSGGPKVTLVTVKPPAGTSGTKNSVSRPEKPDSHPKKPVKARPSSGIRQKYDPIRGLRGLRQRRKSYPLADNSRRRGYRRQRDLQRDEPLRYVYKLETPRPQDELPTTDEQQPIEMVQMPRFTVVDYVLPQVPAPTTATGAGTDTQFVLRNAQPQEVAQAGYEF